MDRLPESHPVATQDCRVSRLAARRGGGRPAKASIGSAGRSSSAQGERVTLWTRHGTKFTYRLPKIAETVRSLPAENALIDGAAVAFRPDGLSDFGALRTKAGGAQGCLVAFDLLGFGGEDMRGRPLEERRDRLARLVRGVDGVVFSEAIEAEGAVVFAKACELGLEGIVSKRGGSLYRSGTSRSWPKSRNPEFVRT